MNKNHELCESCGENLDEDEFYYCYECNNQICDICLNKCPRCNQYFCRGCFSDHKKTCK